MFFKIFGLMHAVVIKYIKKLRVSSDEKMRVPVGEGD